MAMQSIAADFEVHAPFRGRVMTFLAMTRSHDASHDPALFLQEA